MVFTTVDSSLVPSNQVTLVDNGGFEIWQRGTSFTNPVTQSYLADRWQINGSSVPTAYTVTQESSIIDSGLYALKLNITTLGSPVGFSIEQPMESGVPFRNKTLTLSMRVWSNVAGATVFLHSNDGGNVFGTAHTGNSTYQTLTVTTTFSANVTNIFFGFAVNTSLTAAVGTFYLDSTTLVYGPSPAPFVPLIPAVDLLRCQRYYEIGHVQNTFPVLRPGTGGGNAIWMWTPFVVQKRATPTVTATKVDVVISLLGGSSGGDSEDTVNWSISVSQVQLNGASIEYTRATDGGQPGALVEYTWTASADL